MILFTTHASVKNCLGSSFSGSDSFKKIKPAENALLLAIIGPMGPTKKTLGRSHAKNGPLKPVRADSRFQKNCRRAYAANRPPEKEKKNISKGTPEKNTAQPQAANAERATARLGQWLNAILRPIDSIIVLNPAMGWSSILLDLRFGQSSAGSRPVLPSPATLDQSSGFNAVQPNAIGPAQNPSLVTASNYCQFCARPVNALQKYPLKPI